MSPISSPTYASRSAPRASGERVTLNDAAVVAPCLGTGQTRCYDAAGNIVDCRGSGQDGELRRGRAWPEPRFEVRGETVKDALTGLIWTRDANPAELPQTWTEALAFVQSMNRERAGGADDWRLPNRRELRSLVSHQTAHPALPEAHPFRNVFPGWYWTSTTVAGHPEHAWYVHMDGARMFYGGKDQSFLVWPVRGDGAVLPATGQRDCYDAFGARVACAGSGQDGELRQGLPWGRDRFRERGDVVVDRLTGLAWCRHADVTGVPVTWEQALAAVAELGRETGRPWRLPNINELESLVDCGGSRPALPEAASFVGVRDGYWSSTTSVYEPDWAWALYPEFGAVGVGQKQGAYFYVWAVHDLEPQQGRPSEC